MSDLPTPRSPLTPYHRRLFVFLSVATFFEGYDFLALSQVLPNLQDKMGLSDSDLGLLSSAISLGTIVAYALVHLADRWGRRRVMTLAILGYATLTFMTAWSRTPYDFALYQFAARVFLVAQWALSMVYAAEEFPADRRGFAIGVIQGCNALGSITCAAVAPLLLSTPLGWRAVYFVGVAPILLVVYARRNLHETRRFSQHLAGPGQRRGLLDILRSPHRRRVFQLAAVWGLTYVSTNTAILFWKQFAVDERGFTDAQVGQAITIATIAAMPFVFAVGRFLDAWGRRPSAVLIYTLTALFVVLAYQLRGFWILTGCLTVAVFCSVALLSLLNAYTTELFPTALRADAFAWANTLLGRWGYVLAPGLVGHAAERIGWGNAVSLTSVAVVGALLLTLRFFPETSGRELEETSRL